MTSPALNLIDPNLFSLVGKYLLLVLPIGLPIILIYAVWAVRYRWVTMKFIDSKTPCLLEIKIPKEIVKSPSAMEIFFTHLTKGGGDTYTEVFLDGKIRPWFSMEMVSTGGEIRFFVWCNQVADKNTIEAQLYAQYPNIEIFEVEDYTKDYFYDPEKTPMLGMQYYLAKKDILPMKTYVEFGLDEDQKEEYKIDPITSYFEYLGAFKKGENAWLQILIRKHEPESFLHGKLTVNVKEKDANPWQRILLYFFGRSRQIADEVEDEVKAIRQKAVISDDKQEVMKFPNPTKGQLELIAAIERNAAKQLFDCMIRGVYIAEKDSYKPGNAAALKGAFKQYSDNKLNGFKPVAAGTEDWEDDVYRIFPFLKYIPRKKERLNKNLLYAYKLRSYFEWPYKNYGRTKPFLQLWKYGKPKNQPFILSTEELATIFHFPSHMVSQTPTLMRVPSKKSEAPSNLPI